MSVFFVEGSKELPKQFRMEGYGDAGSDLAQIAKNISPFDFLKSMFVDKPAQQQAAQVALAQTQAGAAVAMQQEKQLTNRKLLMVGAGVAGLIILASVLRPHPAAAAPKTAGYRRRRARRSR